MHAVHYKYMSKILIFSQWAGGCMGLHEKGNVVQLANSVKIIILHMHSRGYVLSIDIKPTRKVHGFEQDGASFQREE